MALRIALISSCLRLVSPLPAAKPKEERVSQKDLRCEVTVQRIAILISPARAPADVLPHHSINTPNVNCDVLHAHAKTHVISCTIAKKYLIMQGLSCEAMDKFIITVNFSRACTPQYVELELSQLLLQFTINLVAVRA